MFLEDERPWRDALGTNVTPSGSNSYLHPFECAERFLREEVYHEPPSP
jgi:hypothetical protein